MAKESIGREKLMKKLKAEQKKNADARARKKASTGSLTERARKAAKKAPEKRGLPAKIEKPRGNMNKANTPKEIRLKGEGGTGRAVKDVRFKPIPLGDKPKLLGGPRALAKAGAGFGLTRAAQMATGPVGFLVGMTTATGDGREDKPSGPLMRGGKQPGYKYRETQAVDRSGKGDHEVAREVKVDRAAPKPKARPAGGMTEAKRAAEFRKKAQGQKKVEAPKAAAPKAERPKFRGNWIGAAPTPMQARGGQRIKRKSFSDLFRSK